MKISPQLSDPISENLQKLAALFPAAVKDGMLDVDALREELGDFAEIQPGDEKYELNWVGKQAAKSYKDFKRKFIEASAENPHSLFPE